jgi:hypothetical protein
MEVTALAAPVVIVAEHPSRQSHNNSRSAYAMCGWYSSAIIPFD